MLLFVAVSLSFLLTIYTPFKYVEWFKTNSKAEQFLFSGYRYWWSSNSVLRRLLLCFVHKGINFLSLNILFG